MSGIFNRRQRSQAGCIAARMQRGVTMGQRKTGRRRAFSRAAVFAVVVLATGCVRAPASGGDRSPSGTTAATTAPRVPDYLPPGFEPLRVAPALPSHADALPALTAVFTRTAGAAVTRQVVSRTVDRVHVRTGPPGSPEWLFVRNPVDPRRAAGYLVDHRERAVLVYDDTALAREEIASGWRDVLALGASADLIDGLRPTGGSEGIAGAAFAHYAGGSGDVRVEAWWNDDLFVLGRLTRTIGGVVETFELTEMTPGVDPTLFADPGARHPDYRTEDVDDWGQNY